MVFRNPDGIFPNAAFSTRMGQRNISIEGDGHWHTTFCFPVEALVESFSD